MARTELQSAPRLIQSGYSFSIWSYSSRAVVVCMARRSKSRIYVRVSPRILGLSSFPTRLCPAITARGLKDSILSDQQKRQERIAALDKMESLQPRAVNAGHKRVGNDDSPKILGETRKYIRDFERLAMQTTTARELYDQVLKLYPEWGNRGALWTSVRAVKP